MDRKIFFIPIAIASLFLVLYYLLAKVHLGLLLILLFGIGLWYPVIITNFTSYVSKRKLDHDILFIVLAIVSFIVILLYLSKNYQVLLGFRRVTFLPLYGSLLLLFSFYILKLPVRFFDYTFSLLYSFCLNYFFVEKVDFMFIDLQIMLASWIMLSLIHFGLISYRTLKNQSIDQKPVGRHGWK